MAQTNTVIDLTGLGADKFLESANVNGNELVLTMNDGAVYTADLSVLDDKFVSSASLNASNELVLTMSDGTTLTTDLSTLYGDKYLNSASVDSSGVLSLIMNDGFIHAIDLSGVSEDKHLISITPSLNTLEFIMSNGNTFSVDMTNVQSRVISGQYLHATKEVQLIRNDGTSFSLDMSGVRGALTSLSLTNDVLIYLDENGANTVIDLSQYNNTGDFIPIGEKGSTNGVATLDGSGLVPSNQLPSFVDDVLEFANLAALPAIGESGKIYVTIDDSNTYRWGGSGYVNLGSGGATLVLGETSTTAYQGDRGKIAYDHANLTSGNPHNVTVPEISGLQASLDAKVKTSDVLSPVTGTNKVVTEDDVNATITSSLTSYIPVVNATSVPSTTNKVVTESDIGAMIADNEVKKYYSKKYITQASSATTAGNEVITLLETADGFGLDEQPTKVTCHVESSNSTNSPSESVAIFIYDDFIDEWKIMNLTDKPSGNIDVGHFVLSDGEPAFETLSENSSVQVVNTEVILGDIKNQAFGMFGADGLSPAIPLGPKDIVRKDYADANYREITGTSGTQKWTKLPSGRVIITDTIQIDNPSTAIGSLFASPNTTAWQPSIGLFDSFTVTGTVNDTVHMIVTVTKNGVAQVYNLEILSPISISSGQAEVKILAVGNM